MPYEGMKYFHVILPKEKDGLKNLGTSLTAQIWSSGFRNGKEVLVWVRNSE
ncbi:MAG: hypothetical protein R2941_07875 [Desulfobacterales bacterium]